MKTKAKLKDRRLLGVAVFYCALAALLLWPAGVKADEVVSGGFTVTGSGYTYNGGVLTVNENADLTIRTNPGKVTSNTIVVQGTASITLDGTNTLVCNRGETMTYRAKKKKERIVH